MYVMCCKRLRLGEDRKCLFGFEGVCGFGIGKVGL